MKVRWKKRHGRLLLERLIERVQFDHETGCWNWQSTINPGGYGTFTHTGTQSRNAHRLMYEAIRGPVADGFDLDHLCRNRRCVNPSHLEPVTRQENLLRGDGPARTRAIKAAITHCPNGHPYSGDNLYTAPDGHRDCKACQRQRVRDWQARQKKSKLTQENSNA